VDDYLITERSTSLQPGDLMLLHTNGFTEATNPEKQEFGESRLAELVQQQTRLFHQTQQPLAQPRRCIDQNRRSVKLLKAWQVALSQRGPVGQVGG